MKTFTVQNIFNFEVYIVKVPKLNDNFKSNHRLVPNQDPIKTNVKIN